MRIVLLLMLMTVLVLGCSSPPEKKVIPRSELEKMTVNEKAPR